MTKKIIIALFVSLFGMTSWSYSQSITEQSISIKKMSANAFVADFGDVDKSVFEKAVENYFDKNIDGKNLKYSGFVFKRGSVWSTVSPDKSDIYYKIESSKKSQKLIVAFSKGYENFISSQSDPAIANNITQQIASIQTEINAVKKEADIKNYENNLDDLIKEKKKLEDKKQDIEKDIKQKENEIDKVKAEIEKLKS